MASGILIKLDSDFLTLEMNEKLYNLLKKGKINWFFRRRHIKNNGSFITFLLFLQLNCSKFINVY
ncbi:hypothetical protein TcasGA2_TC033229 [Tribolium castaneum]|uniref:Uncharacterized protein n=1 Tax=Tribolium castaneum TaxID=7070 RepID=A0A139WHF9_TRICA|nr:hypothetical protein TcasGA2_TC033229 [Tribolium castaneum]